MVVSQDPEGWNLLISGRRDSTSWFKNLCKNIQPWSVIIHIQCFENWKGLQSWNLKKIWISDFNNNMEIDDQTWYQMWLPKEAVYIVL